MFNVLLIRAAINPIVELQTMKKETAILPFDVIKRKGKDLFWEKRKLMLRSMSHLL
jgi:hypothetical protein